MLQKTAGSIGSTFARIGAAAAAVGGTIMAAFIPAIKASSDAAEGLNKFSSVFGSQAAAADKFAKELASSVGRSAVDIRDGMAAFGGFFTGLGYGKDEARKFSQQLSSLSIDFASFHNMSDEESMGRFISALSGSSEVLDRFGVNIKQAALEQEIFRMGIRKSWPTITEQQKVLARLNVIMRAMGDQGATGDAVKTAGSFANQLKRLQGEMKDLAVAVGDAIIPAVTKMLSVVNELMPPIVEWIKANPELAAGIAATGVALTTAGVILGTFGLALTGVVAGATALAPAIAAILTPAGLLAVSIGALGVAIGSIVANCVDWSRVLRGVKDELAGILKFANAISKARGIAANFKKNMETARNAVVTRAHGNIGTGALPGFFAPTIDPHAMAGMQKDESKRKFWASQNVGLMQQGGMAGAFGLPDMMAMLIAEQSKALAARFSPVVSSGMKQAENLDSGARGEAMFDSRLSRQAFGRGDRVAEQQLEMQRKIEENTRRRGGSGLPVI